MALAVRLASGVPDLHALGARSMEDFLDGCRGLATADRARVQFERRGHREVRVPLPGTPDEDGRRRELPRGSGTGWLRVHAWDSGPAELLKARLVAPRSTSPAARRWNLGCHLLAYGVGAPRPLALLEEERGLRCVSVLVEAELEGFRPLTEWLASDPEPRERARGLRALGLTLAALFRSGAWLPRLGLDGLWIAAQEPGEGSCAAAEIERLRHEGSLLRERGLRRARLPGVAVGDVSRGRLLPAVSPRRRLAWLTRVYGARVYGARHGSAGCVESEGGSEAAEGIRRSRARLLLTDGERLRLAMRACAGAHDAHAAIGRRCALGH